MLPLVIMVVASGCGIAEIFGPRTLYAPTTCLVDGVLYKSSPTHVSYHDWPGNWLGLYDNGFHFDYRRCLDSSEQTAELYFKVEQDVVFEIGVAFSATGYIYLSGQKYEFTEGWVKFLDYRGTAESYETSYISGAFEFTAQNENGDIAKVTEGTFDELPVTYAYQNEPIWKRY